MKKTLASLLLVLLTFAGCLELDAQDITMRYDEANDRIDIHVVYRGLFAEGGQGSDRDPLAKAIKDLANVRETGEAVFWCNWPFSLDLTSEQPPPVQAMLAHVDIENGTLFTDMQGRLCGTQFVRIREAKAFVQKLNLALELWAQAQLVSGTPEPGGRHTWDADTKDLLREFLRSGEKMIALEPGRIEFRLPLSAKDHAWLRARIEKHFADHMPSEVVRRVGVKAFRDGGGDAMNTSIQQQTVNVPGEELKGELRRSASYRFFWDNEISYVREPELTRIAFGVHGNKELAIKKASDGLYHPALLEKLRADGEKIEDGVPDQELVRRFDAFCKRDAVLPPKVAALRAGGDKGKVGEKKEERKDGGGK